MEIANIKCSKCKLFGYPKDFLKKGRTLKTCLKCRNYSKKSNENNKCEHKRQRSHCKECDGSGICEHKRRRSSCKKCDGASICEHKRERRSCKKCDFHGYLCHIVRSRVYSALKKNKELSSKEYLGCDTQILKEHIEKQFTEGMTWDNYGEWHIDHIVPLKYKRDGLEPSLEEVKERLNYINTQPLWAEENKAKGNRYIG